MGNTDTLCLGLDLGTTTISAVVLNLQTGACLQACSRNHGARLSSTNDWEKLQNVETIIGCAVTLMESLLQQYPAVRTIGLTGQMHGIVYLDAAGRPLSQLYTWQDQRAGRGSPTACETIAAKTGWQVAPGYGLATHYVNLLAGSVPAGAAQVCTIMDYLAMHLCGLQRPVMHSSNAAGLGFYHVDSSRFSPEALSELGLDPAILPEQTDRCVCVGSFRGLPVSVAIGDNQASFLGAVRDPDRTVLVNLGTGSQISLVQTGTDADTDPIVERRPLLEGRCLISGSALCGGRAYALLEQFFRQYAAACGLGDKPQYDVLNRLALEGLRGSCPTVQTTFCGTRADPNVRGSITGLDPDNLTPAALAAGTLQGIVTELYELFARMPHDRIDTLVASGNAVRKNPAMQQILRDVFGMEVWIPVHREEAAYGAALFAAAAAGLVPDAAGLGACIRYEPAFCLGKGENA